MRILVLVLLGLFLQLGFIVSQAKYKPEPAWYKNYDVKFYFVNLEVNDTSTYIKGNTALKILINDPTDTLVFEFNPKLTIDSVLIGNRKVSSVFLSDLLVVKTLVKPSAKTILDLNIYYKGNVSTSSFFSSLSSERNNYWDIPVTWTLSEPFGAKYWFPCKQQLTDKADSCWVFLTVPKGRKAGSVGLLTDTIRVGNNNIQFRWKTKYPIAFYLISFTVADYADFSFYTKIEGQPDSILVQNYVYDRPDYLESNLNDITRTGDFLKLFSKLFGTYPFYKEKYGHCVAPISGGMEHQTMTTLSNFGFSLVAHELAHQWFGNNTTCSTWQDIWLNEGFASYAEYMAYESLATKAETYAWMNSAQNNALRESEGSVFIPSSEADDEYRIFSTNLSYKKGAVLVHMLRKQINNDELFFKSLRVYLSKYRYGNAAGEDFKKILEQETGLNLETFFDQWYYGKGYPKFDISWKMSSDTLLLNVNQSPSSKTISFFKTPFDVKASGNNYDTTIRLEQTTNPQLFKIKLSKSINQLEFDPENWLLKEIQNITQLPEIPSSDNYFEVKPNPFGDSLTLIFRHESDESEKIEIIGLMGNSLYQGYARKKKEITINTSGIIPGTYLLVVSHGNEKYIRKIIKGNIY